MQLGEIFVVARYNPQLYDYLQREFSHEERIRIIMDRRVGERRQRAESRRASAGRATAASTRRGREPARARFRDPHRQRRLVIPRPVTAPEERMGIPLSTIKTLVRAPTSPTSTLMPDGSPRRRRLGRPRGDRSSSAPAKARSRQEHEAGCRVACRSSPTTTLRGGAARGRVAERWTDADFKIMDRISASTRARNSHAGIRQRVVLVIEIERARFASCPSRTPA